MIGSILLLGFVTAERLGELVLARANTARLLASGAREIGAGHYPIIVALHAIWIAGLWGLTWNRPIEAGWFAAFVVLEILRVWTLGTLGRRWTTRILIVPGEALVARGPYRFIRHPNYLVVIGEIAVLPLCFGLWSYAAIFSLLNAIVLFVRIRAEGDALRGLRGQHSVLQAQP